MKVYGSLIVANLTKEEFELFHAAGIGFSGSTGFSTYDNPSYPKGLHEPYIASYVNYLPQVITALKWEDFDLTFAGSQIIVKKSEVKKPKINLEILMYQIELSNV